MASKNRSNVELFDYFKNKKWISEDGKEMSAVTCNLCNDPERTIKCSAKWNLKRHIILKHKDKAIELGFQEEAVCSDSSISLTTAPGTKKRVSFTVDPNRYIMNLVQWVTVGNVPLQFFNLECVQEVLHPIHDSLKIGHMNRHNVIQYIHEVTTKLVKFISLELNGKQISIKADIASRKGRTILGINAQFIKQGQIVVRTLVMCERFDRNTAENIMEEVLKALSTFGVELAQVYSITTDNGSNMLKASKLLRNCQELNDNIMDECEDIDANKSYLDTVQDDITDIDDELSER
ncbi:uncharacterized protein LOC134214754 [Armigeres subalbatus]|uniref:uncharacterized protein LOC134214754 n=1 Tax=Armigeres subalbatus TaxID=124917 RepID=UPI002ED4FE98